MSDESPPDWVRTEGSPSDGAPSGSAPRGPVRQTRDDTRSLHDVDFSPESRYRRRADGGVDELYTINFVGGLSPDEMRQIAHLLLSVVSEGASVGVMALTKVEFFEPDTCQYRYWCSLGTNERVNVMIGLWFRIHEIHAIKNVDGMRVPWFEQRHNPG